MTKEEETHMIDELSRIPYYYPHLDTNAVCDVLSGNEEGTFVLRRSSDAATVATVSVRAPNTIVNFRIHRTQENRYYIATYQVNEVREVFESITQLIDHKIAKRILPVNSEGEASGPVCCWRAPLLLSGEEMHNSSSIDYLKNIL